MDVARAIEAVFDRSDWPWIFTPDGTAPSSGSVTDGNWKLTVEPTTEGGVAGGKLSGIVFGDGMLDLRTIKSDSGLTLLSVGDSLFKSCSAITGVRFNDELRRIGGYAFYASSVGSVQFGTDLTSLDERAFAYSYLSGTADMSMCTNVTFFASEVYHQCRYLEGLVLPPRLSALGWRAVAACEQLKTVVCSEPPAAWAREMRDKPLALAADAIGGLPALQTLELPCGGVVSIVNLRGTSSLTTLKINGKAPSSIGDVFTSWGSFPAQPAYQLSIVVSPDRDRAGWEALKTRAPTDEEKARADYPGSRAFGVLDAPAGARAWLVWGSSIYKAPGSVLMIR